MLFQAPSQIGVRNLSVMIKTIILQFLALLFVSPSYGQTAQNYHEKGDLRLNNNNFYGAIQYYTDAINLDSSRFSSFYHRALAKMELEDYTGAISDLNETLSLLPESSEPVVVKAVSEALLARAKCKSNLEDYRGSISDLTKVIELNPKDPYAYFMRGMDYLLLSKIDEGCLNLSKAGELGHPGAYRAIKEFCN